MTSAQIINEFFARKGGIQWVDATVQGGAQATVSQVIFVTIKQADWLQRTAQHEGSVRKDFRGHIVGTLPDDATWNLGYPSKNSRVKAATLQIVK